jgi:hypothetical protein
MYLQHADKAIEKERDTLFECASCWQPLQLAAPAGKKKKTVFLFSLSPFSAALTIDRTLKCQTTFGLFF